MTESQAEDLAVKITRLFIPLDLPDTLGSINFAEKAAEVAGILIEVPGTAELLEALKLLKEDYADAEGCYCGQIVGGTKDGEPLHICGYCKADAALRTANAKPPGPEAPAGGKQKALKDAGLPFLACPFCNASGCKRCDQTGVQETE